MVIIRKTVSDFETEIAAGINSRDTMLDTSIGPVKDLYITPPAEVMRDIHDNIVYLSQLQSLKYASRVNPNDLDDFVFNENLVRWRGSPSVTTVTFSRLQPPDGDILVPINFPLATTVDPATGRTVEFRTIERKIMYGPTTVPASSYYNSDTGRFEISVSVTSVGTGSDTAVGAYTITRFRRSFPDFDYVTNKQATTSGLSIETNSDLTNRYLLQVRGNNIGTPTGLKLFSLDNFSNIQDAYVVYGNNPAMVRNQNDAGAVDNWIMTEASLTDTIEELYAGVGELIPVPKQPVIRILSVTSGGTEYLAGTHYEFVSGQGIYAYSDRANDGIRFLVGSPALPALNAPVEITYSYNSMINVITTYYRQPEYYILGSDVLFRWAQPLRVELEAQLKIGSGNPDDILTLVRSRVLAYITSLRLGNNLEEFDIDGVVSRIYGVDNWVYTKLAVKGGTGVSDIDVPPNQYAFIEDADLVISLVF